ncbi:MAG: DUF421 domain-containing protein [Clostridia bacterium]|nr:DUF421 domain-containing protein [Clostridia bacterium]
MDWGSELLITFIRTVIFYLITIIAIRVMGKRQIGQLEPTELVVTIMISELATMPIQDIDSPIINTVISIFSLVALEILISVLSMKSQALRYSVSGKYSILIDDGKINIDEMRKVQLTVDELMEELRQKGVLNPEDVRYCILETSGKMSVFSKKTTEKESLPLILISDGKVVKNNLKGLGLKRKDLENLVNSKYGKQIGDLLIFLYNKDSMTAVDKEGIVL